MNSPGHHTPTHFQVPSYFLSSTISGIIESMYIALRGVHVKRTLRFPIKFRLGLRLAEPLGRFAELGNMYDNAWGLAVLGSVSTSPQRREITGRATAFR